MLKRKSAVVTGSTSGIGLAIAKALAEAGANVMLNGFGDPGKIEETRAELAKITGVTVLYSPADMTKPVEIAEMIGEAQTDLGSVDILVNNAGIQHVAAIEDFPEDKFDAIIAINMSSNWHAIKAALPLMKKNNWGRIINLASAHGLVASPYKTAYVMAKHGVVGLTKTIAMEVAELDITCNAICPGYVRTPLVEGQIEQQAKAHGLSHDKVIRDVLLKSQPSKKFVETSELGGLAVFLCSEHAASITGTALPVDGGWTAH